jgi:peroxin-4
VIIPYYTIDRSMASKSRILKELKAVQEQLRQRASSVGQQKNDSGDDIVDLYPDEGNLYEWYAVLRGPTDTPYSGGTYTVKLTLPPTYPMSPPQAKYLTTIFHPNVHFKTGEICLDILKNEWSPAWTLLSVCQAILALMNDPAADSPLNCDAGNLLRAGDLRAYNGLARMYAIEYASSA